MMQNTPINRIKLHVLIVYTTEKIYIIQISNNLANIYRQNKDQIQMISYNTSFRRKRDRINIFKH